eukprot:5122202-Alexandrium_andersonii.AAC.1
MRPPLTRGARSAVNACGGKPVMRVPGSGPGDRWRRSGRGARRPRSASGGTWITAHPQVCVCV